MNIQRHRASIYTHAGAGDGMVTAQMSGYFNKTYATEMSGVMARKLTSMGYQYVYVLHSVRVKVSDVTYHTLIFQIMHYLELDTARNWDKLSLFDLKKMHFKD